MSYKIKIINPENTYIFILDTHLNLNDQISFAFYNNILSAVENFLSALNKRLAVKGGEMVCGKRDLSPTLYSAAFVL